jgi:hypothetical protein
MRKTMKQTVLAIITAFVLGCTPLWATDYPVPPLSLRLKQADNVFVGEVLDIQAIDSETGELTDDPQASSAPGEKYDYRLIIRVDQKRAFKTAFDVPPRYVVLTYGHKRHLKLRHEKEQYLGKSFVFLTNGKNHRTEVFFSEPVAKEAQVIRLLRAKQTIKGSARGTVDGRVVHKRNGVEGVEVSVHLGGETVGRAVTDRDGRFRITHLPCEKELVIGFSKARKDRWYTDEQVDATIPAAGNLSLGDVEAAWRAPPLGFEP